VLQTEKAFFDPNPTRYLLNPRQAYVHKWDPT